MHNRNDLICSMQSLNNLYRCGFCVRLYHDMVLFSNNLPSFLSVAIKEMANGHDWCSVMFVVTDQW